MDRAVQIGSAISSSRRLVTAAQIRAEQLKNRFDGQPPQGLKFLCPCCMREIVPAAFDLDSKQVPHFKHRKNDPFTHRCDNYMAGNGDTTYDYRNPVIPLFLRKSRDEEGKFNFSVGFWCAGETLKKSLQDTQAWVVVEDNKYDLRRFINPNQPVEVKHPCLNISSVITFKGLPQQLSSGVVEDAHQGFIFNDDFGKEGGRRVRFQDSIEFGREYYVVAPQSVSKKLIWKYDAEKVGTVQTSTNPFWVTKISISENSLKRAEAEQELASFGYALTNFSRSSQLLWPPSTNFNGVDIPLFSNSPIVYKPTYQNDDAEQKDQLAIQNVGEQYGLDIPLIGLQGDAPGSGIRTEYDSGCLFIRPRDTEPWLSVLLDKEFLSDLNYSDCNEATVSVTMNGSGAEGQRVEVRGKYPLRVEVAAYRSRFEDIHFDIKAKQAPIPLARRQIMRITASNKAFPRSWYIAILNLDDVPGPNIVEGTDGKQAQIDQWALAHRSLGYKIAVYRAQGISSISRFERKAKLLARERRDNELD